ncbi:hypothetical protein, partial [Bacillus licheniformis]|uniref:hypothetical protein n=1 Tax=Bacillus licheniformis TaxID=1402 RepID=UPI00237D0713
GDGGSRIDKFYIGLLISEMALYQVFYVYQFSLDKYKILIGSSHFLTTKKIETIKEIKRLCKVVVWVTHLFLAALRTVLYLSI